MRTWAKGFQKQPEQLFLVHGEQQAKMDLAESIRRETGMNPTVVTEVSEYELETGTLLSHDERIREMVDEEMLEAVRKRISDLHFDMEDLLYRASLSANRSDSPVRLAEINNKLLELEKSAMGLSSALSDESLDKEDNSFGDKKENTELDSAYANSNYECPYCGGFMNKQEDGTFKCDFCGCTAKEDKNGQLEVIQGGI